MDIRFITPTMHAFLDYPVAFTLMAAPLVLGLGASNPLAFWLSVATGVAAFVLTLLTDHKLGVFRVLPYWFHLAIDFAVGITFLVAAFALGFQGIDQLYYVANALAVLTVVGLHQPAEARVAIA